MEPTRTKTSAGMETLDETVNRINTARSNAANNTASVPVDVLENPPTGLDLPQVEFDPTTARTAVEAATGFATQQQAEADAAKQQEQVQTQGVRDLMGFVSGKGAERTSELEKAGIPESNKQLADLTTSIRLNTDRLAQFADQTFLGEEQMRQDAAGKDITKGTFSALANERRLQRAVEQTGKAAALRTQIATAELLQNNITAATAQIDAALEAKYSPVEQALQNEMFFLQRQWQVADKADQRAFDAKMNVVQEQQNAITNAKDMVLNAMPYATPEELQAMNDPSLTPEQQYEQARTVVARGQREDRAAEIKARNLSMAVNQAELNKLLSEGNPGLYVEEAAQVMAADASVSSINSYLTSVFANLEVPAAEKTNVANQMAVNATIESLASSNPEGKFRGMGPTSVARGAGYVWDRLFSSENLDERVANQSLINQLKFQVTTWATGAAVSGQQEEDLLDMVPQISDNDAVARQKLNQLYNTMNDITETRLRTAGINIPIPQIDLFEEADLVSRMSPEQRQIYQDALEASNVTSTPAYAQ